MATTDNPRSGAAAARAQNTEKADENKARVDAINAGRETVEASIRSILSGGDPEQAIAQAEAAAASVPATKKDRHPLYAEALRLKKAGTRGPGRKLTDDELAAYAADVKAADRGLTALQELEVAYWVEGIALGRGRWLAIWNGEARERKPKAEKKAGGKAAERIATLNAHKAAAKAARDAGHPIPDGQLATMDATQAEKVERARRTRQAPPAMASAS